MDKDRIIDLIRNYYRRNQFAKAKDLIKKAIAAGHRSVEILKYSGLIALLENDLTAAEASLKRVRKVEEADAEVLNALAFINLKNKDTEAAIDLWLEILDNDPENRLAKKNLQRMKKMMDVDAFIGKAKASAYIRGGMELPFSLKIPGFILAVLLLAVSVWFWLDNRVEENGTFTPRKSASSVKLPVLDDFILSDINTLYSFDSEEIPKMFKDAKRDIKKRNFNGFIIRLNKILHSNVKDSVKQRFVMLREFLPEPETFSDIRLPIRLTELFNQQTIYEDCYLVLNGKVENLKVDGNTTSFNMKIRDMDTGETYLIRVQNVGRLEKMKNSIDVRVLCRFKNVVTTRGVIIVESLKVWVEQKEFLELDKKLK